MRVLVVANYKQSEPHISPFITEQIEAIAQLDSTIEIRVFKKVGHGVIGYLSNLKRLRATIKSFQPQLIHAHYGFCGALACLQRQVPVVTTYHGSDINIPLNRLISRFAILFSKRNIFVSDSLRRRAHCTLKRNATVIPCGVSTNVFRPLPTEQCREQLGLRMDAKYVLFPASHENKVKNFSLATEVIDLYNQQHNSKLSLIALEGYSREQVAMLMNAVDAMLFTSLSEGSPQVVKEAIATGCPIASVTVGDVAELTEGIENAFLSSTYNAQELVEKLNQALTIGRNNSGVTQLKQKQLTNTDIAKKVIAVYCAI